MAKDSGKYYLPDPSGWPIVGSIGLFCLLFGAAHWLHQCDWSLAVLSRGIHHGLYAGRVV